MKRITIVTLVLLLLSVGSARAESPALDPLLQLLVKKGVITEEEARSLQAEAAAAPAEAAPAPPAPAPAPATAELPKGLKGLSVGTLTYLSYQDGTSSSGDDYSRFRIKRGYLDVRKKMTDYLEFRVTPDVTQDSTGDLKLRLKYAYAKFGWEWEGAVQDPYVEFGVAHMPWLDFEEHVNLYRMQDTMFMERNGLFNSADLGVMFGGNFGPQLPEDYRKTVNDHYAGRWGSFAVGVVQRRRVPRLREERGQGAGGAVQPAAAAGSPCRASRSPSSASPARATSPEEPDWEVLAGMLSYESPRFVAAAQYESGTGNQAGTQVDPDGEPLDHDGYSLFTEVRLDSARQLERDRPLRPLRPSDGRPGGGRHRPHHLRRRLAVHEGHLLAAGLGPPGARPRGPRDRGPPAADPPGQVLRPCPRSRPDPVPDGLPRARVPLFTSSSPRPNTLGRPALRARERRSP